MLHPALCQSLSYVYPESSLIDVIALIILNYIRYLKHFQSLSTVHSTNQRPGISWHHGKPLSPIRWSGLVLSLAIPTIESREAKREQTFYPSLPYAIHMVGI